MFMLLLLGDKTLNAIQRLRPQNHKNVILHTILGLELHTLFWLNLYSFLYM